MGPADWMVTFVSTLLINLSSGAPLNGLSVCRQPVFKEAYFDGHPIPKVVKHNFSLPLRCKAKYYDNRTHSVCLDGTWGPLNPPCRLVECPEISASQNSKVQVQGRGFNETASFTCAEGYWYTGSKLRICQRNGQWDGMEGKCEPVRCMPLPEIENGKYHPPKYALSYNNKIFIRCHNGYQYTGPISSRTCQGNNEWSGIEGKCVYEQNVTCTIFTIRAFVEVSEKKEIWKYNETVKVGCKEGYTYNGSSSRVCLINSTWSGQEGVCKRVICAPPMSVHMGIIERCDPCVYKTELQVTCNKDYLYTGASIICQKDGSWKDEHGKCEKVACGAHPGLEHGFVNATGTMSGDVTTLTCREPYTLTGSSRSVCEVSGKWSAENVKCAYMVTSMSESSYSADKVIPIVISIVILVVVAIIAFLVWKYRNGRKHDIEPGEDEPLILRQHDLTENNRKAILRRGHVIGRGKDKRIDLNEAFIDPKMVPQTGREGTDSDLYDAPSEKDEKQSMRERYEKYTRSLEKEGEEDVFIDSLLTNSVGKFLLLRGRAGVGKTTVLHKIVFEWAKNEEEWTKQFDLALMFNARYLSNMFQTKNHKAYSLTEFLNRCCLHEIHLPEILPQDCKILLCIDGLDEFQSLFTRLQDNLDSCTEEAEPYQWCIQILKRKVLTQSTLVATSRHMSDLTQLKPDQKVDLVGLTEAKVKEYIELNVSVNKSTVENIIRDNPILRSVCTITFFCMMLCRALEKPGGEINVDRDLHSYTRITSLIFKNLLERNLMETDQSVAESRVKACISKLSKLAYRGLFKEPKDTKIIQLLFSPEDIKEAGFSSKEIEDAILLGLVISSDTFTKNDSSYLEFIHLSVQEILAMAHLLTMDEDQIKDALEKMWKSPLFSGSALQHLFGLCYDSHDNIEELMGRVGKKAVKSTTLKKHLYAIIHSQKKPPQRYERLCAIQMAYESHDPEIAKTVVDLLYGEKDTMEYVNMHLTAVDLKGILFAAGHSTNICKLKLHGIMNDSWLEDLGRMLAKDKRLKTIAIEGITITEGGLNYVFDALKENTLILELSLDSTDLNDIKMRIVTEFFKENASVKTFSIARNNISEEAFRSFIQARRNKKAALTMMCDSLQYEMIKNVPEADENSNTNIEFKVKGK